MWKTPEYLKNRDISEIRKLKKHPELYKIKSTSINVSSKKSQQNPIKIIDAGNQIRLKHTIKNNPAFFIYRKSNFYKED